MYVLAWAGHMVSREAWIEENSLEGDDQGHMPEKRTQLETSNLNNLCRYSWVKLVSLVGR